MSEPMRWRAYALCALLSGCASYQPKALLEGTLQPEQAGRLTVDVAALAYPVLAAHRFDPSDGLDVVEAAMLAVVNNPDLKLARDDAAVARAQSFASGLLPDPVLTLGGDVSDSGGATVPARSAGLAVDVSAMLMAASARRVARADDRKTDLNLLWQEWQVISQVQLLFTQLAQGKKTLAVLDAAVATLADPLQRSEQALARALVTQDAVTPLRAALQDAQRQVFEQRRVFNQRSHEFNAVLGLAPDMVVRLQGGARCARIDNATVQAALATLAQRRPDLLALAAGYQAQDQRYRGALLAQFPALNVGLTRARDSGGVASTALGVTLSLPFFNRNRGQIAIETASRQKLFDEYQLRLQSSRNDIDRIVAEQQINADQLAGLERALAQLNQAAAGGARAFYAKHIDALVYANTRSALLAKQLELITLQQTIEEQGIAVQTLLGVQPAPCSVNESDTP